MLLAHSSYIVLIPWSVTNNIGKQAKGILNRSEMCPKRVLSHLYKIVDEIGGGTCGDVLKGIRIDDKLPVALKKIKYINQSVGFPPGSLCEIEYLNKIKHPNVMKLIEVCTEEYETYLVFEYFPYDLYGLMYKHYLQKSFTRLQVRCYTRQLLLGLNAIHTENIIHRDIKPANILINSKNILQIADFGLAKKIKVGQCIVDDAKVITIWYRPPELLLGLNQYGKEIDIWSVGCIIYEMIARDVLFRSIIDQDLQQLGVIFSITGIPSQEEWPEWVSLQNYQKFINTGLKKYEGKSLESYVKTKLNPEFHDAIPLILSMLQLNPKNRITVSEALKNDFVASPNGELDPENLPPLLFSDAHQNTVFATAKKPSAKKKAPTRPPQSKLI